MLQQKSNKKKDMMLLGLILLIILVIAFILFKDKIFGPPELDLEYATETVTNSVPETTKKIDLELFNEQKFNSLINNQAPIPDIDDLEIGKNDPFYE